MPPRNLRCIRSATLLLFALNLLLGAAWAQTETVLYSFGQLPDAGGPNSGLTFDGKGNLYGVTEFGGANDSPLCSAAPPYPNCGTVYNVTPLGKETVLYSFCVDSPSCTDGYYPTGDVVVDGEGNVYGTTSQGGVGAYCPDGCGTVFRVTPSGKETVLYNFCSQTNCADGDGPTGGLVVHGGAFYGWTSYGGAYGSGAIYTVTPSGKETVVYSFPASQSDGSRPNGSIIFDAKGNVYGTSSQGGAFGSGSVFKVTPSGTYTILYSFCSQRFCPDGANPNPGLVIDPKGNVYGTTQEGGNALHSYGTVFRVTPAGKETVLYAFCSQTNCADGAYPYAGLVSDGKSLYGTTSSGGPTDSYGVAFKVTSAGEKVLYNFCSQSSCTDGAYPESGLVFDTQGNLYGTTFGGVLLLLGLSSSWSHSPVRQVPARFLGGNLGAASVMS